MDLFLIRHGESFNNALEDASLRVADPEWTEKGTAQIARVAEFIGAGLHLYPGERDDGRPGLDRLYCSAMIRACHTAQPIGRALGLAPEVWLDIHEIGGNYLDHGGDRGGFDVGIAAAHGQMRRSLPDVRLPQREYLLQQA